MLSGYENWSVREYFLKVSNINVPYMTVPMRMVAVCNFSVAAFCVVNMMWFYSALAVEQHIPSILSNLETNVAYFVSFID